MKNNLSIKANFSFKTSLAGTFLILFLSACGTVGKEFDESRYVNIVKGTTTHKEIRIMFGPPFRKGVQNGEHVWTYEYNYVNAFGTDIIKDMIVVFDKNGVVKSHQLMTNNP